MTTRIGAIMKPNMPILNEQKKMSSMPAFCFGESSLSKAVRGRSCSVSARGLLPASIKLGLCFEDSSLSKAVRGRSCSVSARGLLPASIMLGLWFEDSSLSKAVCGRSSSVAVRGLLPASIILSWTLFMPLCYVLYLWGYVMPYECRHSCWVEWEQCRFVLTTDRVFFMAHTL
jgi:hypothetical protein